MSGDLEARVTAIEARQRAHEMHDADCPAFAPPSQTAGSFGGLLMSLSGKYCNCWLADPVTLCPSCRHSLKEHAEGHCFRGAEPLGKDGDRHRYRLACPCTETPKVVPA